jgi:hypothetical protein
VSPRAAAVGSRKAGIPRRSSPEPVAICRLKRVAADFKEDIRDGLPKPAATKNGKRIALIGGGPASLTVARDLAPLGYHCVVFDGDALAGGMMPTQIPKFRLPETVIDEEVGLRHRLGRRISSGPFHRQHEGAARPKAGTPFFVGSGRARADATSTFRAAAKPRPTSTSASIAFQRLRSGAHDEDRQARPSVLGGGQHGDGLLPQREAPGRRGRAGRRRSGFDRDESFAVGKRGRRARGHSRSTTSSCRKR